MTSDDLRNLAYDAISTAMNEQVEIRRHAEDPGLVQLAECDGDPVQAGVRIEIVAP